MLGKNSVDVNAEKHAEPASPVGQLLLAPRGVAARDVLAWHGRNNQRPVMQEQHVAYVATEVQALAPLAHAVVAAKGREAHCCVPFGELA